MRMLLFAGSLFLGPGAAHAQDVPCSEAPRVALLDALQAASVAWSALDGDGLDQAMARVRTQVGCLREPAELDLVLAVHQAHARHAWTTYDPQVSARAWLAVRDLAPEWTDAYEADVPPDHPVRELWKARKPWTTTLDEQPPGGWIIDGTPGTVVPLDRAFWLQALDRRGQVAYSAWHVSAADVPQTPWRIQRVRRMRVRGTIVAGVVMAGGLAALGGAGATRLKIQDPSTPDRDLLPLQTRQNVLAGVGVGAIGASAVAVAVLWGVRW